MNSNPQGVLWWQLCYGATSSVSFINTFWHHGAILSSRDFPFGHSSEPLKRLDLKNRIPFDGWLIAGCSSSTFNTCIMAGETSCTSWQLCLHRCARPRESLSLKSSYCRCLFIFPVIAHLGSTYPSIEALFAGWMNSVIYNALNFKIALLEKMPILIWLFGTRLYFQE